MRPLVVSPRFISSLSLHYKSPWLLAMQHIGEEYLDKSIIFLNPGPVHPCCVYSGPVHS